MQMLPHCSTRSIICSTSSANTVKEDEFEYFFNLERISFQWDIHMNTFMKNKQQNLMKCDKTANKIKKNVQLIFDNTIKKIGSKILHKNVDHL